MNQTALTEDGKTRLTAIDSEIDIVAVDAQTKSFILGECKFRNAAMDASDLERLKAKSSFVKQGAAVQYALFSKSGFTKGLQADTSVRLFPLSEIVNG